MKTRLQPPAIAAKSRHHPDGTRADHHRNIPCSNSRFVDAVHSDRQRLDHRTLGKRNIVGQLERERGRVNHGRPKNAMNGRRGPKPHRGIEIVDAESCRAAVWVRYSGLHANTVTRFEIGDTRSGLHHHPGGLVAKDHRLTHDEGTDGAVLVVVNVASADADGAKRDANVMRSEGFINGKIPK